MQKHNINHLLINELSPYLLQHATDVIYWHPWEEETFAKAAKENKMLFIHIGSTACALSAEISRCHFSSNSAAAAIINSKFIPVLVDKDERPDLNHFYLSAKRLLAEDLSSPVSYFALPDGTPVASASYSAASQLAELADEVSSTYRSSPERVKKIGSKVLDGITGRQTQPKKLIAEMSKEEVELTVSAWREKFDMMLEPYDQLSMIKDFEFILEHTEHLNSVSSLKAVMPIFDSMAKGKCFDHLHGGFFGGAKNIHRPNPCFEKTTASNALLVSLYAKAYTISPSPLYKKVIEDTLMFCIRELASTDGGYYTSLISGEACKGYYAWSTNEFKRILGDDALLAAKYYGLPDNGSDNHHVLHINATLEDVAKEFGISTELAESRLGIIREKLFAASRKREHPGVDDKQLTSTNALMAKAFADAYRALGSDEFLIFAEETLGFISRCLVDDNGKLFRYMRNGELKGEGFLDDYAYTTAAMIKMHHISGENQWLYKAKKIADSAISQFYNNGALFYSPKGRNNYVRMQVTPSHDGVNAICSTMAQAISTLSTLQV